MQSNAFAVVGGDKVHGCLLIGVTLNLSYLTKYHDIICNMTMVKYNSCLLTLEIGKIFKSQVQEEVLRNALSYIELCKGMII